MLLYIRSLIVLQLIFVNASVNINWKAPANLRIYRGFRGLAVVLSASGYIRTAACPVATVLILFEIPPF